MVLPEVSIKIKKIKEELNIKDKSFRNMFRCEIREIFRTIKLSSGSLDGLPVWYAYAKFLSFVKPI